MEAKTTFNIGRIGNIPFNKRQYDIKCRSAVFCGHFTDQINAGL